MGSVIKEQISMQADKHTTKIQQLGRGRQLIGRPLLSPPVRPLGRPTKNTDKLAQEICDRIASNQTIKHICQDEHMPAVRTVFYWLNQNDSFLHQWNRALEVRMWCMMEEVLAIADSCGAHWQGTGEGQQHRWISINEAVKIAGLQIGVRKRLMSQMMSKRPCSKAMG